MRCYYNRHRWEVNDDIIDNAFILLDKDGDNTISKGELFTYINLLFKGAC